MSRLARIATVLAVTLPVCVAAGERVTVVAAGDVADLYAKVNARETAGHTLLLSGTYVLDPALGDEAGPATRGGYLDLGDRSLVGTNVLTDLDGDGVPDAIGWDASSGQPIFVDPGAETFIDASGIALDPPGQKIIVEGQDGFRSLPFNRPLIRAPEGNTVQGVTVRWNVGPLTLGTINIQGGRGGRVRDCVVENGDMGIVMSLPGLQHDGDVLTATVTWSGGAVTAH